MDEGNFGSAFDCKMSSKESYDLHIIGIGNNTYANQNGSQYKAWDQLYPSTILPNGRMKERTFHENYGFDVQKVGTNYRIMDLIIEEHANRLYQNIERGNLQLAKFLGKDGEDEQLFITPNIPVGCFDVFTLDRKPVSLELQVEKGYSTEVLYNYDCRNG
ncbi:hypothetical protein [Longitalea luteola]|uniref:hypothetical protein n=1 Tax=Longitalea luteola TaxID=2812563 RepID=UPI001A966E2E|nr:hypothetical protein [Longitalea luteola]